VLSLALERALRERLGAAQAVGVQQEPGRLLHDDDQLRRGQRIAPEHQEHAGFEQHLRISRLAGKA
jgi:hypothetical protein